MDSKLSEHLAELDATFWRILRNAVLRTLAGGKSPIELTLEQQVALLEPFDKPMQNDVILCREVLKQAFLAGVESVHQELHGQPGVDSEMLDEAIEFHSKRVDGDDGEGLR